MSKPSRPLIVRLRNWVGDATLGLPLLQRLADAGYSLTLVGKPWAHDLLAGHGWPVHTLPKRLTERVRLLRALRRQAQQADAGFDQRVNAVALPYSFSSAMDMRLAGLRAIGHAHEGRSWLLARSVQRSLGTHEINSYWQLGNTLLGENAAVPPTICLRVTAQHQAQAAALLTAHGVQGLPGGSGQPIVVCPFAGGTFEGQDKTWPEFVALVAQDLPRLGRPIVVCPGPGEEAFARQHFASALVMPNVDLGTYAALLEQAALMISNDTGPGHMAAAVGTPLLSVLGPSDPAQWRAWGPSVHIVQGERAGVDWPRRDVVFERTKALLSRS